MLRIKFKGRRQNSATNVCRASETTKREKTRTEFRKDQIAFNKKETAAKGQDSTNLETKKGHK